MASFSLISLLSAIMSTFGIIIAISIFNKVYQEEYKRPWFFIALSTLFLGTGQLLKFFSDFFNFYIVNVTISEVLVYVLDFISITILAYALLLENMILRYYKGKFVKMKFLPVQEGTLGGEIDLNVSKGNSYLALKKERSYLLEQVTQATKKGFEGFLIIEDNPKQIREKYKIFKTPIAWISHIDSSIDSDFLKDSLDENSDITDPLHLNNIITYLDNFLEQSESPIILLDLNLILRTNNYIIVLEFLRYVTSRIQRFSGILIVQINIDILTKDQLSEIKYFMKELE